MRMKPIILGLTLCLLLSAIAAAAAPVSPAISLQGKLTDAKGYPLSGSYNFQFKIFDVASGGTALWTSPVQSVPVSKGIWQTSISPPDSIDFNSSLWLEVTVGTEILSPRSQLMFSSLSYASSRLLPTTWPVQTPTIVTGNRDLSNQYEYIRIGTQGTEGRTNNYIGGFMYDFPSTPTNGFIDDAFNIFTYNNKNISLKAPTVIVVGPINLNKGLTGVAMRVNEAEALWYDGDYFSWGYGGSKNYFARPIGIGTTNPAEELHIKGPSGYQIRIESPRKNISLGTGETANFAILDVENNIAPFIVDLKNNVLIAKNLTVDNINYPLFVDATNNRVGIGTGSPGDVLHVKAGNQEGITISSDDGWIKSTTASGGGFAKLAYVGRNFSFIDPRQNEVMRIVLRGSEGGVDSGFVGIGTTNPLHKLDVNGEVSGNALCINEDCLTAWPSGGVGGSGTTNRVAKWTGASSLGNSIITDDGTSVSVAGRVSSTEWCDSQYDVCANPLGDGWLHVRNKANTAYKGLAADTLYVAISGTYIDEAGPGGEMKIKDSVLISHASNPILMVNDTTNGVITSLQAQDALGWVGTATQTDFYIGTRNNWRMIIKDSTASVGIGTQPLRNKLQVYTADYETTAINGTATGNWYNYPVIGVYGQAKTYGVYGVGTENTGVYAKGQATGLFAESTAGDAIWATSPNGWAGYFSGGIRTSENITTGPNIGKSGRIYSEAGTGYPFAIRGLALSTNTVGVSGEYGDFGGIPNNGVGVFAYANNGQSALRADSDGTTPYAIEALGKIYTNSNLEVAGTSTLTGNVVIGPSSTVGATGTLGNTLCRRVYAGCGGIDGKTLIKSTNAGSGSQCFESMDDVLVQCPTGYKILGGGCLGVGGYYIDHNYPSGTDSWFCSWNGHFTSQLAYAICCKVTVSED